MISVVSPVYMAEKILSKLVSEIQKVMVSLEVPFEIILVDDRSPDGSWEVMKQLSSKFSEVKSLRLSRNFGQHPAIMAGLSEAKGDWIVVMDCDMQDQPKEIAKLYNKAIEGYDAVMARRIDRKDNFFKKITSYLFSQLFNYLSDVKMNHEVANFGIYHKKVIQSVLGVGDYIKSFPLFVYFVGFNSTSIAVEHLERESGKSSYNLRKLLKLAFDSIFSYSNKPLWLFVQLGAIMSFLSFCVGIYYVVLAFLGKIEVSGFASLIVSIFFLSGIIISVIGIVGVYLGKVFEQTKKRPAYIFDEKINIS